MSEIDEAEYQRLAEAVRATEKLAAGNPNIRQDAGAAFLEGIKGRMEILAHDVFAENGSEKKDKKNADNVAIAAMVERETRLSAQEKEVYAGFLEKDYFTKKDFKNLDSFYATSYDKLSDDGKAQMSTRIQEGILRGEFEFSDLPERVQKSENEFQQATSGRSHEVVSSKASFEEQPKGGSQAATERSEVAEAAKKFAKGEKRETDESTTKDSDLGQLAKISPTDLSNQKSPDSLSI